MDASFTPGGRCRSNRPISHHRGVLERHASGTILSTRENIGRELVTVGFDSGERLVVFAHELEPVVDTASIRRAS
jgi:hypothetical protein